jgi:hypothetical protein
MSKEQPTDTDLINELVATFGRNQKTLHDLVLKVEQESKTNFDPISSSKIKMLRRAILIEDVKGQELKIEMMSNVLKEICSTPILPTE